MSEPRNTLEETTKCGPAVFNVGAPEGSLPVSDEIELLSDDDGLAVVGEKSVVERFLSERGLLSNSVNIGLHKLGGLAQTADALASGASEIAANSGRWLKLTEKSAALRKEFGLTPTKTPGMSHAMVGDPGKTRNWIQADTNAGALLTNPALLADAAGVMAQMARQQEMRDIKAYLSQLDTKVTEVLRAQKDAELSKLFGARLSIERAMSVRKEQGGRTDPTTWTTVQDRVGGVDDLLSWAILSLNRVAEKLDEVPNGREHVKLAKSIEGEAKELLAVMAHCFELQDALDVLRLDRVLEESPRDLDAQRSALEKHRQERRSSILEATNHLVERLDGAAGTANSHLVLHPRAAQTVTGSANGVGNAVADFHVPLGINTVRQGLRSPRWRDAVREGKQLKSAGEEAGPKLILPGLALGGVVLYAIPAKRSIAKRALKEAFRILKQGPS
jgi:hypothetical protein